MKELFGTLALVAVMALLLVNYAVGGDGTLEGELDTYSTDRMADIETLTGNTTP